jgi:hypothetical protein
MNYGCGMRGKKLSEESKKKISKSKIVHSITEDMIADIEKGISRNKFGIKYGSEQPWRRYRQSKIKKESIL